MKAIRVLVLTLVFLAIPAKAESYLFGLTSREIETVMDHYKPRGYDLDETLRQMSAPFDCRYFDDLCREVGERNAEQMVKTVWTYGRQFQPAETIARVFVEDLESLHVRWVESQYPNGIPERDPYWGIAAAAAGGACDDTVSATSNDGDEKIVHKSRKFNTFISAAFATITVEHFEKNVFGNFKRRPADTLEVQGTCGFVQANFEETFTFDLFKTKDDVKEVSATRAFGILGLFRVKFVEGCGGVPGTELFACSCLGELP